MPRIAGVRAFFPLVALLIVTPGAPAPARAQTGGSAPAVVNGRRIALQEVDDSILPQLLPLQRQIYELRRKALDNLIFGVILEAEAERRGVTVEELRRRLTDVKVAVPPAEVEKLYAENASALAAMSPDEARERIRLDLESQARMRHYLDALSKLREGARVEIHLEEVRLPVTVGGPAFTRGPEGAPVTIVEFSDFQ